MHHARHAKLAVRETVITVSEFGIGVHALAGTTTRHTKRKDKTRFHIGDMVGELTATVKNERTSEKETPHARPWARAANVSQ
jgi:hypothetical protein